MAVLSNNHIARAIYLALKDKNKGEQSVQFDKVVKFLFKRRLLSKSRDILSILGRMINQEEGRVIAHVSSVEKLDPKMRTQIEQALKKRYKANEVIIAENINKELLGGIKIEVNDEVIDLSIKSRIGKLQTHLTKIA